MTRQQNRQTFVVQHGHAQSLGFVELAARFGSGDHVMGFFADRARHFGPQRFEFFFGFVAAHALQGACQHHGDARQRHFGGGQGVAFGPVHACIAQGLHHFAVVRLVKKAADAVRHHRAHVGHLLERVFAGGHDGIELAEMAGQLFGRGFAHMADAQAEHKAPECGGF